jgi:hypothetical protein
MSNDDLVSLLLGTWGGPHGMTHSTCGTSGRHPPPVPLTAPSCVILAPAGNAAAQYFWRCLPTSLILI